MRILVIILCLVCFGCTYKVKFTKIDDNTFEVVSKRTRANTKATYSDNGTLKEVKIDMMQPKSKSLGSSFGKLMSLGMWPLGQYLGKPEGADYNNTEITK